MRKKGWLIFAGLLAVVLLGAVAAGPWAYKTFVERPPEPVLALPSGAQPAATDVNGSWTVQPGSLVGYRVQQQLLWEMVDVNGRTDAVTGGAEIRESRLVSADFTVDVGTFDSGRPGRDERFRGTDVMDSASFPTATVRMNTPVDLAAIPEDGAAARLEVPVHLTLKGVTRRETAQIEVQRTAERVDVAGTIPIRFFDFNVDPPKPPASLLAVQPVATIEFLVHLAKG
ncbi:MAG: YceI family protein [Mycolicibacterium neoaurum]|nr:YceI family protein [Mycolicibacterium neoaurum]